jgi:hypothetical protein
MYVGLPQEPLNSAAPKRVTVVGATVIVYGVLQFPEVNLYQTSAAVPVL